MSTLASTRSRVKKRLIMMPPTCWTQSANRDTLSAVQTTNIPEFPVLNTMVRINHVDLLPFTQVGKTSAILYIGENVINTFNKLRSPSHVVSLNGPTASGKSLTTFLYVCDQIARGPKGQRAIWYNCGLCRHFVLEKFDKGVAITSFGFLYISALCHLEDENGDLVANIVVLNGLERHLSNRNLAIGMLLDLNIRVITCSYNAAIDVCYPFVHTSLEFTPWSLAMYQKLIEDAEFFHSVKANLVNTETYECLDLDLSIRPR